MKRAVAALLLVGCKGKESPPPPPPIAIVADARIVDAAAAVIDDTPDGTEVPQAPNQPPEFAPWVQRGADKLWRGTRKARMTLDKPRSWSFQRDPMAIDVQGGKMTVFEGARQMVMDFALTSPCIATATEVIGKGAVAYHAMQFVVKNGVLHVGEGTVGMRRGKTALVCGDSGDAEDVTIVDESGACEHWGDFMGRWPHRKETCAWSQKDGRDVLTIGTGQYGVELTTDGDVFMDERFVESEPRFAKTTDFAEAKAAVTHELVWQDPVARAKAVGGVVGKTDTVASLIATNGPKDALSGRKVVVTGVIQRISAFWSDERAQHELVLVDSNDTTGKVTIRCVGLSPFPAGLADGDTVTVSGTVDADADLKKCSIAGSMPK